MERKKEWKEQGRRLTGEEERKCRKRVETRKDGTGSGGRRVNGDKGGVERD